MKDASKYALNWKPAPKDPRDFKFSALLASKAAPVLPEACNVNSSIPEVFDQGQIGSCTGNSTSMGGLHQSRIQSREITPSRLMLYYGARDLEGSASEDAGANIRDIYKAWAKLGVCPESVWPYDESQVTTKPSADAYTQGLKTLALTYHLLDNTNLDELKSCLAIGHPFVLGFTVYKSFMGSWASVMPMPAPKEQVLGGHAVLCVGYDNAKKAFLIKNSWGADWKQGGYFWMPYDFITNQAYCDDFWMLEGITPGGTPIPTPSNITSIIDLKKVFLSSAQIKPLNNAVLVCLGHEMGLNTDIKKTKTQNLTIVCGGLGIS